MMYAMKTKTKNKKGEKNTIDFLETNLTQVCPAMLHFDEEN